MTKIRSEPCSACPYRRDVPSGVWAAHEYDKLREYDEPTGSQPFAAFACHATPDHLCNGWAVVHSNRGHEYELLALRMEAGAMGALAAIPTPRTELFASGNEAADWGQRDVENPSVESRLAVERLTRKYPRLRAGDNEDHNQEGGLT